MSFIKYIWVIRAIVYRVKFKKIGRASYLGKPIFLLGTNKIIIGNRVRIYPGSRMETHGDSAKITIEDNVSIGQNFHIVSAKNSIVIGKDTTISGNVFITNTDHDYKQIGIHVLEQELLVSKTTIGENCFIGYGAVIQAGTVLGKQCIVGSNAVVRGVFPDYCVIAGVPAITIKRYSDDNKEWIKV